eukprot:gene49357-32386_t
MTWRATRRVEATLRAIDEEFGGNTVYEGQACVAGLEAAAGARDADLARRLARRAHAATWREAQASARAAEAAKLRRGHQKREEERGLPPWSVSVDTVPQTAAAEAGADGGAEGSKGQQGKQGKAKKKKKKK